MFDFDAGKLLIIGVVALIVIGPKELPRVLRQVGQAVGRMRRMAAEFQGQFMDAMKEADLDAIRQDLNKIGTDASAQLNTHFDPARDIQRELTTSLEQPALAAAVPSTAELPPIVATDAFALPLPDAEEIATPEPEQPASLAAAGIAPVAAPEWSAKPASETVVLDRDAEAVVLLPAKKRKILVRKRRGAAVSRVHSVTDRTAVDRTRPLRLRTPEIAGQ